MRGESFEFLGFKGLNRNGVWGGFDVLKFSKGTEKSFLDVRHNFEGKILI